MTLTSQSTDISTLPSRQQAFIAKIVEDWPDVNLTAAALHVGYSARTAGSTGQQLVKHHASIIDPLIEARKQLLAKKATKSKEEWLTEIQRCAFFDPRKMFDALGNPKEIPELDDDSAAAIAGFEFAEEYIGKKDSENKIACGYTKKFKLTDKLKALKLFGEAVGYYVAQPDQPGLLPPNITVTFVTAGKGPTEQVSAMKCGIKFVRGS